MQSREAKTVFYYQASASALGGFIDKPLERNIRTRAAAVLPVVGGLVTAHSDDFRLRNLISFSSASVEVSGRPSAEGFSIRTRTVIENLNILGAVRADRVVGEVSVDYTPAGRRFSFGDSDFKRLRFGRNEARPVINPTLVDPRVRAARPEISALNFPRIQDIGITQAQKLVRLIEEQQSVENDRWALNRYDWMRTKINPCTEPGVDAYTLCSLIDRFDGNVPDGRSLSHVLEIPDVGRFFFGEILVSGTSLQLTMIRAELGCPTTGGVHVGMNSGGGHTVPPISSY